MSGHFLVQARTTRPTHYDWPEKVPAYLTDLKKANFGMLNGRLVCHDYGLHMMREVGIASRRMVKARWHGE